MCWSHLLLSFWEMILCMAFQLYIYWYHVGSLKLAMIKILTPWKLATKPLNFCFLSEGLLSHDTPATLASLTFLNSSIRVAALGSLCLYKLIVLCLDCSSFPWLACSYHLELSSESFPGERSSLMSFLMNLLNSTVSLCLLLHLPLTEVMNFKFYLFILFFSCIGSSLLRVGFL